MGRGPFVSVTATGCVPRTTSVTERVTTSPFGPPSVRKVYVVVADGDKRRVPRAWTRPMPGDRLMLVGFSVRHVMCADSSGLMAEGSTVSSKIRATGHGKGSGKLQPRLGL